MVKNPPAMQKTWVRSLGQEDSLERKRQPTAVFLPGEFPGQSPSCCRVRHDKVNFTLYVTSCFSFAAFKILYLWIYFSYSVFGVILFRFISFGTLCASWTWMSVSFARLGKFSTIISSNRFSVPFCLSSGMLVVQMLVGLMLS